MADATTMKTDDDLIVVAISYFEENGPSGALIVLVFIADEEEVDYTRSILLALDRETSRDFTLPPDVSPGGCRFFVYDIKQDGTLPSDVNYPAVSRDLIVPVSENSRHGIKIIHLLAYDHDCFFKF